jgi:hypothetical protein
MRVFEIACLVLTAVVLSPGGAHLFAAPNKLTLGRDDYFVAQRSYRGWALFGAPLAGAILADGLLAWRTSEGAVRAGAGLAAALLLLTLILFALVVAPANQATDQWRSPPADWARWRARWETGHALNALISLAAFCALAAGVVR